MKRAMIEMAKEKMFRIVVKLDQVKEFVHEDHGYSIECHMHHNGEATVRGCAKLTGEGLMWAGARGGERP